MAEYRSIWRRKNCLIIQIFTKDALTDNALKRFCTPNGQNEETPQVLQVHKPLKRNWQVWQWLYFCIKCSRFFEVLVLSAVSVLFISDFQRMKSVTKCVKYYIGYCFNTNLINIIARELEHWTKGIDDFLQVRWYNMGQLDRIRVWWIQETMTINDLRMWVICVTTQNNMPFSIRGFVLLGNSHLFCVKRFKTEKMRNKTHYFHL